MARGPDWAMGRRRSDYKDNVGARGRIFPRNLPLSTNAIVNRGDDGIGYDKTWETKQNSWTLAGLSQWSGVLLKAIKHIQAPSLRPESRFLPHILELSYSLVKPLPRLPSGLSTHTAYHS
jgi:hypothetical protein